jgi:hypothetical protein
MSKQKTGGAAFPEVRIHAGDNYNPPTKIYHPGMTLRDYFAAAALQGLLVHRSVDSEADSAESAYRYADAMLAAREVK